MPRPTREYTRIQIKLDAGSDPNAPANLLRYYSGRTGLDMTWILETGLLILTQEKQYWIYCPKCKEPVTSSLLPGIEGAEAMCKMCGHEFIIAE